MIWFFSGFFGFLSQIFDDKVDYFLFDRGIYYLVGCSILFAVFTFLGFYHLKNKKSLSDVASKKIGKILIIGMVLIVLLPAIASLLVPAIGKKYDYFSCPAASDQNLWVIFRSTYYVRSEDICISLAKNFNDKLSFP